MSGYTPLLLLALVACFACVRAEESKGLTSEDLFDPLVSIAKHATLEQMVDFYGDDFPDLNLALGNELSLAANGIDDNGWMTFKQGGGIDCSKQEWAPEIAIVFDLFPKFALPDKFAYVFLCRPAITCIPCLPYHLEQKIKWVWSKVKIGVDYVAKKARYLKFKMNPRPSLHKGTNKRGTMTLEDAIRRLGSASNGIYTVNTGGATALYYKKDSKGGWHWSPDKSCWMSVRQHKAQCGKYEGEKPVGLNLNLIDALGAARVREGLRSCYTIWRTHFEGNWLEGDMYKYGANWWAKDLYYKERNGKWSWSPDKTTWMPVSTFVATGGAYRGKEPTADNKMVIANLATCSGATAPVNSRDLEGAPTVDTAGFKDKLNAQTDVLRKCKEFADSIQAELGISFTWKKPPFVKLDMTFVADPSIGAECIADLTSAGIDMFQNRHRKNPMMQQCTKASLGMCHLVTKTLWAQRNVEYAWSGPVPAGQKISLARSLDPEKMCDKIPSAFYQFPSATQKKLNSGCDAMADIIDKDDDWEETKITHKIQRLAGATHQGRTVTPQLADPWVFAYCHGMLRCPNGDASKSFSKVDASGNLSAVEAYWKGKFTSNRGPRWFGLDAVLKTKTGTAMNAHINSKASYVN